MGVKVQHSDWSAIYLVKCPEGWKSNAMITTQCEQLGFWVGRMGECWSAGTEFEEGRCHLLEGKGIVERCYRNVPAVKDCIS